MALGNKKISVMADTTVDSVKVATYSATVNVDTTEVTVTTRYTSSDAYEAHKAVIEKDRDEFVVFAMDVQKSVSTVE